MRPTYGLTEEEMEDMLLDALDHGEQDMLARRLAEARVEAERVLLATRKSLGQAGAMLEPGEDARIGAAIAALEAAVGRQDPGAIRARIDDLDRATTPFAARRMNDAIAKAIAGRAVGEVEHKVERAKGVDAHVEQHEKNREGRKD